MKRLTKVIAVTAAAAMSFSCFSAYAAQTAGKSGRMSFQNFTEKSGMKIGALANEGDEEKSNPIKGLFGIDMPGTCTSDKNMNGERKEKPEMTEEEKAERLEKIKAGLAAKLEAGEITQEKYDEAIASIESGCYKFGRKNIKGGKNRASDMSAETNA